MWVEEGLSADQVLSQVVRVSRPAAARQRLYVQGRRQRRSVGQRLRGFHVVRSRDLGRGQWLGRAARQRWRRLLGGRRRAWQRRRRLLGGRRRTWQRRRRERRHWRWGSG